MNRDHRSWRGWPSPSSVVSQTSTKGPCLKFRVCFYSLNHRCCLYHWMVPHYMNQTISDQATGSADVAFGGLCWIIINFHLEAGTDKMEKGLFKGNGILEFSLLYFQIRMNYYNAIIDIQDFYLTLARYINDDIKMKRRTSQLFILWSIFLFTLTVSDRQSGCLNACVCHRWPMSWHQFSCVSVYSFCGCHHSIWLLCGQQS